MMNNLTELSREDKLRIVADLAKQSRSDPVVFVNAFLYTFNPRIAPYHFPFLLFDFQRPLILQIKHAIEVGDDIFIEKCREMGATYIVLAVLLWFWLFVPGSNFLLGSRKETYVDNRGGAKDEGESNKEESLFGKLEYMFDRLPDFLKPVGFNSKVHFTFMSLTNPENGNIISGESTNRNFSRGGRYKAVLLDEFAFWEHDAAAWGSTADTTSCRIVLTTPGDRPSKAKRLRNGTDGEKIQVITLPYYLDPRKTPEWLEKERARRSPEDFAREIEINWDRAIGGVIYTQFKREVNIQTFHHVFDQHGDYYFGMDFAVRGWTAVTLGYINTDNKLYILDEYKVEGQTAVTHAKAIKELLKQYAPLEKWTGYADPAGWMKNQQKGDMIWAIADEYIDEGLPITQANNQVVAGINYVRQEFASGKLIIHNRCIKLVDELFDYRWKELTEARADEEDEPEKVRKINDHLVDALRYLCYSKPVAPLPKPEKDVSQLAHTWPIIKLDVPDESGDKFEELETMTLYD